MVKRTTLVMVFWSVACVLPAWAQETKEERTVPTRSFERFDLESETVNGFWAEAGALFQRWDSRENALALGRRGNLDIDVIAAFARLAYGADKWEGGLTIPYSDVSGDFNSTTPATSLDADGIGDVKVYGKYVPMRSDMIDIGVGGELSLPSGDEDDGLGEGELGGMPFLTGAFHVAVADVRGHVGGLFFAGSSTSGGLASNRLVWGIAIQIPLGDYVAVRNEFAGSNYYDLDGEPKVANYLPGLDIRVPIGSVDLLLRPTGMVGITEQAPSWGVGGSIAIASPTMRAPSGSSAGDVFVE